LVFLDPSSVLSEEKEFSHYQLHQNNPNDLNYRAFLNPAFQAVQQFVKESSSGLDFGCGPGPTLSIMLEEAGHTMQIYDKYFHDDKSSLSQKYDFITCTEVIEHISPLNIFLVQLISMLKPKAHLIVMTNCRDDKTVFSTWYYRQDPTHISFLNSKTAQVISEQYDLSLLQISTNLLVFQKR